MTSAVRDAALDLLLGASCVGCGEPGRLLCPACEGALRRPPFRCWPSPAPPGMAEPWASAAYDGSVRAMVLGLKERRLLALARPLAALLAGTVAAALEGEPRDRPVLLVPVPSRRATVRARGHDPTWTVTSGAATLLARSGWPVRAKRLLRVRAGVLDQSGLGAEARAANLAGAMRVRMTAATPNAAVVVCDDVLTTGSTIREAQRALGAVGLAVVRLAVVAATARVHSPFSDVRLSSSGGAD